MAIAGRRTGRTDVSPVTLETLRRHTADLEAAAAHWIIQDADEDDGDADEDAADADDDEQGDLDAACPVVIETAGRALVRLDAKHPATANLAAAIFRYERQRL